MSTPATAALSAAGAGAAAGAAAPAGGSGAAGGAPAVPAGSGAAPGAGAAPAANQPSWYDTLLPASEPTVKELREWVGNKNFKDPAAAFQAYREVERSTADLRAAVALKAYPSDVVDPATGAVKKADEAQVRAWNTAMGVPATAQDYKIESPKDNPYPKFTDYMAEELHQAHVPAAMAQNLVKGWERALQRATTEFIQAQDTQSQLGLRQLEQEWGPHYQERTAIAQRGLSFLERAVGGLSPTQLRDMESILSTPKYMQLMYQFGAGNKEAGFAGGSKDGGAAPFAGGVDAMQQEYDQLKADYVAGKVSRDDYRKREPELANRIAAGMAPPTQQ